MLHKRSIKEKLLKGGAWAFSGRVVMALSGLVISGMLARLLNPEQMGVYFLTLSLVSAAALTAQLGLTQLIVRLVAESMGTDRPGRGKSSVLLVLRILGISGLLVACIIAFGAGQWIAKQLFNSEIMGQVMGLAAIWIVIQSFQRLLAEVFRGFHDIRLATIFGGLSTSLISMALFIALWILQGQGSLEQIILLSVGAGLTSVLISSALLWGKLNKISLDKHKAIGLREVLSNSWPLWITSLTLFVLVQADLWIMGLFLTSEDVAVYGSAVRLVAIVSMPLMIVNAVVPPIISEMYAQGNIQGLEKSLRLVATMAGLPSLLILGVFVFFGEEILVLVFGEYYQTGYVILAILSVGQLVNVWSGSCGQVLMLTGNQTAMMMITIFCGLITILLAWWLVLQLEGIGVAIAAGSGMILQNLLMLFYAKKKAGVWTHANPLLIKDVRTLL